jgi:hypothetical protein
MIKPSAQLFRAVPTVLFCLTLTGVADAAAPDGPVVGWGEGGDYNGLTTIPDAINGVSGTAAGIAVGDDYSCAIQAGTGEVICWGYDADGQATPPDAVNGVSGAATGIAAGTVHTLAILRDTPLLKAQQACVNEMNKNGEKVNKAQLKENERCLRNFQAERLVAPMTFDACTTADQKGRVQRAEERTATQEAKRCDSLDVPPPFAYTDSATVNAAAVDGALALTYAIFGGPPVLDDNLYTRDDDTETAKCQLEMLKRADNLENTVLKEVIKAKKKALKDETVDSAAAIESELQAVLSSNDRITRTEDRLVKGVDRKCAVLQAAPDTIFPGGCGEGNPNLNEVEACVIAAARCQACLKINAFDDLNLDCDQADDQDVNGSCPAADGEGGVNHQQLTNADCFPSSVPDSASQWAKTCIALANSAPDMVFTPADYQGMPEECKSIVLPECH